MARLRSEVLFLGVVHCVYIVHALCYNIVRRSMCFELFEFLLTCTEYLQDCGLTERVVGLAEVHRH
jgi:hypothetical protein